MFQKSSASGLSEFKVEAWLGGGNKRKVDRLFYWNKIGSSKWTGSDVNGLRTV